MNSMMDNKVVLSNNNSTKVTLPGDSIFLGEEDIVSDYLYVIINYVTNVSSATDGVELQFSPDATTWTTHDTTTSPYNQFTGTYGSSFSFRIMDKYFRFKYVNGSTAQNFFSLQIVYRVTKDPDLLSTPRSIINSTQTASVIRMGSEYKRDVSRGLISFNTNYIVNGMREGGVDTVETDLTNISSATYIFPQTARKIRVKAGGNANDDVAGTGANYVTIVGLDSTFTQIVETLPTAGTSESAWTTQEFIRVNICFVSACGTYGSSNEGAIVIENDIENLELTSICPDHGRAISSVYTVPKGCSVVITRAVFMVDSEHSATIKGYFRKNADDMVAPFESKQLVNYIPGLTGDFESKPEAYIQFDEMTDFWITAEKVTGTGNADVTIVYDLDFVTTS